MTFVGDLDTAIAESRAAAGDKCVNVLGASVAAQCLAAGVLDEVAVTVMPVLLGDGTRLFDASRWQYRAARAGQRDATRHS